MSDTKTGSGTLDSNDVLDTAASAAKAYADIAAATRDADPERADLLAELAHGRHFLRFTTRGLSDEQAAARSTASELCLGGLVKHVTMVEKNWGRFITDGPVLMRDFTGMTAEDFAKYAEHFRMAPGETLQGVLDEYAKAAAETDERIRTVPDLNAAHPLPSAPWFPPGAKWSARRAIIHIISETAQHAGHADIIRESIDGAKSMG